MRLLGTALLVGGLALVGAAEATVAVSKTIGFGVKFNPSPSLPKGWYIRADKPIGVGTLVWFRMPALMDEYETSLPGATAWFANPENGVLKPVAAIGGDTICRDGLAFSVNGRVLGTALAFGPSGAALPVWSGCRRLGAGELAVFSGLIPDSEDSRYFGPISQTAVVAYRPLLTEAAK